MDDGRVAFDLLVCDTLEDAARLSEELVDINKQRQNLTEKIVKDIKNGAADMVYHGKNTIFVYDKDWKIGVLGLIAGRLSREHNKPTFALTNVGDGIVGSGRSIDAFDMIAALHAHEDLFERFGGHKQACGLTIADRDILHDMVETIDEFATEQLENVDMTPILNVDMEIDLSEVTWDFVDLLTRFEPFGMGNSQPLFLIRGARICGFDLLGKKSNHIRFSMCDGKGIAHKMMAFSKGNTWSEYLKEDLMVDVVCTIGINYWRGNKSIQMTIEDIRPAEKHLT
jgi:single-stranded-DNA-specific exonuclease